LTAGYLVSATEKYLTRSMQFWIEADHLVTVKKLVQFRVIMHLDVCIRHTFYQLTLQAGHLSIQSCCNLMMIGPDLCVQSGRVRASWRACQMSITCHLYTCHLDVAQCQHCTFTGINNCCSQHHGFSPLWIKQPHRSSMHESCMHAHCLLPCRCKQAPPFRLNSNALPDCLCSA